MNILNALQGMGPAMLDAVGQGVLWGIMVLGVYITYKLLDIADLTVDGSFALGGCVCAMLILNKSMNPVVVFLRNRPWQWRPWPVWQPDLLPASCTPCLRFLPSLQES